MKDAYKKWQDDKNFIIDGDKLKGKSFVFSSFPTANKYGYQSGKVRPLIYGDIIARYERMLNKNVLYPVGFHTLAESSFIESRKASNMLTDDIANSFLNQMLKLGIGVNEQKIMDMRHEEYLSNLQLDFIELYQRGFIVYKDTTVYQDKKTKKIYDYMQAKPEYEPINMKAFVLKCAPVIENVLKDIDELDISPDLKDVLKDAFGKTEVLSINLQTESKDLNITLDEPELLGGVTYIFLNPDLMDVMPYVSEDEEDNVREYIRNPEGMYVYSGNYCTNPLTGYQIPIFISQIHNKAVYTGNPISCAEDRLLAENEGFEIIDIFDFNGLLIHSDVLNGLTKEEGRKEIFKSFIEMGIAESQFMYKHTDILISSNDPFGALFPFLDDRGELYPLTNFLPYSFSVQFRPVLDEKCDIPGNPIPGTMNSLFVLGMAPILAPLYDELGTNEHIFSAFAEDEYEAWGPIKSLAIDDDMHFSLILMPIILNNIIRTQLPNVPKIYTNIKLVPDTFDINHENIQRSNNNMINIDELTEKYNPDAVRSYFMLSDIEDDFIFNENNLKELNDFIEALRIKILNSTFVNENNLDFEFFEFENKSKILLEENEINKYVSRIIRFSADIVLNDNLTKEQLLTYLRVIYPILPFLSEEAYGDIFNSKYSIINEGWPN